MKDIFTLHCSHSKKIRLDFRTSDLVGLDGGLHGRPRPRQGRLCPSRLIAGSIGQKGYNISYIFYLERRNRISRPYFFLCFFSMQAYRFSHFCKIKIGCPILFALPLLPECCTAFFSPVISPAARRSSLKMRSRMHIGTRSCVVNRGESKGSSLARSIEKIFLLYFPSSIRLFPSNQYRPQRCVLFWDFASAPPPCSVDTSVLSLTVSSRAASKRTKASKREV